MNKTIYVNICQPIVGSDCYGFYRSESRILVNLGIGLSKLGYDIYFGHSGINKDINNNIHFMNQISGNYDYAIFFESFGFINNIVAEKYFLLTYNRDYTFLSNLKNFKQESVICTPYFPVYDFINLNKPELDLTFFPALYPNPIDYDSFLPFDFTLKNELRIYCHLSVYGAMENWKKCLINDIKTGMKKFNIEVIFQAQTEHCSNVSFVTQLSKHIDYKSMYDRILECDAGLVFIDSGSASGAQFDILSLGKPMLIMALHDPYNNRKYVSPLLDFKDEIFCFINEQYDRELLYAYLYYFLHNTKMNFNYLRETIKEYNFINWKKYINKHLNL